MGNLTFTANNVSFKSLNQFCNAGACANYGRFYSCDEASGFGPPPLVSSQEFEDREVTFPGVDDVGIKRFGRRTRTITCSLDYVYATKANAEAAIEQDFGPTGTLVQLARYTIVMPGGTTHNGCRLVQGGMNVVTWGPPIGNAIVARISAVFKQYSQTN